MAEERKHTTLSGYELKRVYTEEDIKGEDLKAQLGEPGHYPFTRGIRENMYRDGKLWTMGQYAGFASAEEANRRFRYIIEQGGTGFSVALDLPTQMGYDSDDPMSEGEVGKVGVAIDSLADIEALFKGIPFEKVRQIRTTANANSIIMLAFYVAFAKKNNIDPNSIGFFLQNDILKEYMCRGTYIFPPAAGVKLSVDVLEYCGKHLPHWTPIAVSGYHIALDADSGLRLPHPRGRRDRGDGARLHARRHDRVLRRGREARRRHRGRDLEQLLLPRRAARLP